MSLVKIEFKAKDQEEAIIKLHETIEKIRYGYTSGEGFDVLENFVDSVEE